MQSLRDLSELNIDFGQSQFSVRPWLKDNMSGHDFRKVHFKSLLMAKHPNLNICSLQNCLINGNPGIRTHLTIYQVFLIYGDILSLDAFPCLVKTGVPGGFSTNGFLQDFHRPRLTHFLPTVRDCIRERMTMLTKFMTHFQTLGSNVFDIPKPCMWPGEDERFAQAIAHQGCTLKYLYFTCNGNELRGMPFVKAMYDANSFVSQLSCRASKTFMIRVSSVQLLHRCG